MRNAGRFPEAFEPFDFAWDVAANGYRWITTTSIEQPEEPRPPRRNAGENEKIIYELDLVRSRATRWLTDGVPSGGPRTVKRYAPLRETGLFRNFADTKTTEEAIAAFASRYGSLLGQQGSLVYHGDADESGRRVLVHGEELQFWSDEIYRMGEVIELWQRIRREDRDWLSRVVRWRSCGDVVYEGLPRTDGQRRFGLIADPMLSPSILKCLKHGDVLKAADFYKQQVVDSYLEPHTSLLLLRDRGEQLRARIVPKNLLGWLWLQLARAIDGDRDYGRCPPCQKWLELGRGRRSNAVYCSAACKQAAYRERHHP
jgi:hypothetical protein